MTDLTKHVAPKTDQLNADDLLGGKTKTILITGVKEMASKEQPIAISYEGDNGKPWKPCLGMRRVLIDLWGEDAAKEADKNYKGRSVTLYRDPDVKFGSSVMGGIRISHASHIDSSKKVLVTVAKARRVEFMVQPLKTAVAEKPAYVLKAEAVLRNVRACETVEELESMMAEDLMIVDELNAIKAANESTYDYVVKAAKDFKQKLSEKEGE